MERFEKQHNGGAIWLPKGEILAHSKVHQYSKDYWKGKAIHNFIEL
jgi:hypothetical protein